MKLTPVSSPAAIQPTNTNSGQKRSAAIEAFNKGQSSFDAPKEQQRQPENHSVDPNNISPEELSAVKPQEKQPIEDTLARTEDTPKEVKPEKDPALQRQFAQLARQERQLRAKAQQQEQQIKAREAALEAKEQAIKATEQKYSEGYISRDQLKQDTLRILADSGVSYDELTQQILNQPSINPQLEATINALKQEINSLKSTIDEGKQQQSQQQQDAYKAAVKQIETDVRQIVTMDPQFETIKATKSISDVVELIEETYKQDGYVMPVEEACQEVENYLVEEAMKLTRLGKIKRQLEQAGQPKPTETAKPKEQTHQQGQAKTLTNAISSTRKLTNRERAIAAMEGRLKD